MSDVLVLCYHAISPSWPAVLSVTPQQLHAQLRWLVRRGYRGATFSQALEHGSAGKLLAVTFDDAFRSVLELALPVLDHLGLRGRDSQPRFALKTSRAVRALRAL